MDDCYNEKPFNFSLECAESTAQYLLALTGFKVFPVIILIVTILAFCLNIFMLNILRQSSSVKQPCKILLMNCCVAAVLISSNESYRAIKGVQSVNSARRPILTNSTALSLPSFQECSKTTLITSFSSHSLLLSVVFLSLERLISTQNFNFHQHSPWITRLTILCLFTSWMIPVSFNLAQISRYSNVEYIPLCIGVIAYPAFYITIMLIIYLVILSIIVTAFVFVVHINHARLVNLSCNAGQMRFSLRLQLSNNLEVSRTVLCPVMLHLITYTLANATILHATTSNNVSAVSKFTWILFSNGLQDFYMLLLPISMLLRNKKLRSLTKQLFLKKKILSVSTQVEPWRRTWIEPTIQPASAPAGTISTELVELDITAYEDFARLSK